MASKELGYALQSLFEQGRDPMFISDGRGRILHINAAFSVLYGYDESEVVGLPMGILLQKSLYDVVSYKKMLRQLIKEGRWSGELHVSSKHGEIIPVWTQIIRNEHVFSAIQIDLRERDKMSRKMEGLSRLQSVATLAGGVAHEFNNILGGIQGHLYLFKRHLPDMGDKEQDRFKRIDGLMKRATSLVQNLLAFAKQKATTTREVALGTLLEETVTMLENTIDAKIHLSLNIIDRGIVSFADPVVLKHHIFELITNAEAAILRKRNNQRSDKHVDDERIDVQLRLVNDEMAEILIRDNGAGMQDATLRHCFDPFFTTEPVGQGTGLGLSSALSYMQQLKGSLEIESSLGEYTTIRISLPLMAETQDKPKDKGLILLVDDDQNLRQSIAEILGYHGYRVETASNGVEGLDLWHKHAHEITAVVMDIVMPKMDGMEVAREIRKLNTLIPVCLMTGYTHQRIPTSLHVNLMRKPLNPDLLLDFLERSIR